MTYAKPKVICLGDALAAIQHMAAKAVGPGDSQGSTTLQTIPAYDADE